VQGFARGPNSDNSCGFIDALSFTTPALVQGMANTIATDNPGVGAQILDPDGHIVTLTAGGLDTLIPNLDFSTYGMSGGYRSCTSPWYPYTVQLVRTPAAITSPTVHWPILTFQYTDTSRSLYVTDTNSITVQAALIIPTCTLINTPPVALGTVSLASLTSPGDTGPVSPAVHIQATCPGTLPHLSIGFVDSHNHANQTSILSNTGSATNVGVQLLQADAASPLVLAHNYAISNPPNVTFDLHARMINNGTGPVQAGSVQATALYTLSYW